MTAPLTPATELAAKAKTPFPGASSDYERPARRCSPRRSSSAAT